MGKRLTVKRRILNEYFGLPEGKGLTVSEPQNTETAANTITTVTTSVGVVIPRNALDEWDEFLHLHVGGRSDRELLISVLWHTHQARNEVAELRGLVEKIEEEANSAMASLNDPATMMQAARSFLGS